MLNKFRRECYIWQGVFLAVMILFCSGVFKAPSLASVICCVLCVGIILLGQLSTMANLFWKEK